MKKRPRSFNFGTPKAEQTLVLVGHHLDFLIDALDKPEIRALSLAEQMTMVTNEIQRSNAMDMEHAICTVALCLLRLMEYRHASPGTPSDL